MQNPRYTQELLPREKLAILWPPNIINGKMWNAVALNYLNQTSFNSELQLAGSKWDTKNFSLAFPFAHTLYAYFPYI